jgi:serine/threonine protein kinase
MRNGRNQCRDDTKPATLLLYADDPKLFTLNVNDNMINTRNNRIRNISSGRKINLKQYENVRALPSDVAERIANHVNEKLSQFRLDVAETFSTGSRPNIPIVLTREDVDFNFEDCLGQGSFSSVFAIQRLKNVDRYDNSSSSISAHAHQVIKMLQPKLLENPKLFAASLYGLVREGVLLSALSHDNIVKVLGWSEDVPRTTSFERMGRHDAFFLILDRLEITLKAKLARWRDKVAEIHGIDKTYERKWPRRLKNQFSLSAFSSSSIITGPDVPERLTLLVSLAIAIAYLHSNRILHRDLKPDNIAFDANGTLKIIDFDIARFVPKDKKNGGGTLFRFTKGMGSPRYMVRV